MKKNPGKRGRPKKAGAKSAAERMRAYRKRKRDAGLVSVRRWESADASSAGRYSDHRILDGADAAEFLDSLRSYLEAPVTLIAGTSFDEA